MSGCRGEERLQLGRAASVGGSPYQAKDGRWGREEVAADRFHPPAGRRGGRLGHGNGAEGCTRKESLPVAGGVQERVGVAEERAVAARCGGE